jgi:hypothetical protein
MMSKPFSFINTENLFDVSKKVVCINNIKKGGNAYNPMKITKLQQALLELGFKH